MNNEFIPTHILDFMILDKKDNKKDNKSFVADRPNQLLKKYYKNNSTPLVNFAKLQNEDHFEKLGFAKSQHLGSKDLEYFFLRDQDRMTENMAPIKGKMLKEIYNFLVAYEKELVEKEAQKKEKGKRSMNGGGRVNKKRKICVEIHNEEDEEDVEKEEKNKGKAKWVFLKKIKLIPEEEETSKKMDIRHQKEKAKLNNYMEKRREWLAETQKNEQKEMYIENNTEAFIAFSIQREKEKEEKEKDEMEKEGDTIPAIAAYATASAALEMEMEKVKRESY